MDRISTDSFLTFCRSLQGQQILTLVRRMPFSFRVVDAGLEITSSKNKRLSHSRKYIDRVLDHFDRTRSFTPSHYTHLTFRASYTLPLIQRYLQRSFPSVLAASSSLPSLLLEGALREASVILYARNPEARDQCIKHYGCRCSVCDFDFERVYGKLGSGFIIVHHLKPMSERREEYVIDPIADLRPVCANCHAMIHRSEETVGIEVLREVVQDNVQRAS